MAHAHTLTGHAELDWKAVIGSGVIAGLVFLMLEMIMVPLFLDGSPWGPPRMIAAMVMGEGVLPPPATFAFGIVMVALLIHFALSIVYAIAFDWVLGGIQKIPLIAVGALFGLALYLVNFYIFTEVWPWFAMARNWVSIFAHIVYGAVLAWSFKAIAQHDRAEGH